MSELPLMAEVWQETLQWQPSTAQQTQFQRLYELILEGNRQLNLTRITEPAEFWEKHLWDSLAGVAAWVGRSEELEVRSDELGANTPYPTPRTPHSKIIDIGTGAGFPGLPVAIARPDWHITLLDSTRKKVAFLETLVASLGLENVKTWCDRAEQIGQNRKHRETYDLALIRAVAPTSVCAEYALPLLKVGGSAILYRGQWTEEETQALQPALKQLGGEVESIEKFSTPLSQSLRHCLHLRKTNATAAEFPRLAGVPTQKPL